MYAHSKEVQAGEMHSFLCAFPTFHGSCKYARREKLCIVPSIVFCTGKVPFLYKTYAILMHTRYHCGAKVCVWRTAAETCTDNGKCKERAISLKIWHSPAPSQSFNTAQPSRVLRCAA